MPETIAALTMALLVGMVLARVLLLRRKGIAAMQFGSRDRTDFLIPPFAVFFFYLIFANAFHWAPVSLQRFFPPGAAVASAVSWIGVLLCLLGLLLFLWSLVSFGQSFRVGIDADQPGPLITSGVFAYSRNPIYTAFAVILLGQFLIFPNWIVLLYLGAAAWLFHRQVLREEAVLRQVYGQEYAAYCQRVRRYL